MKKLKMGEGYTNTHSDVLMDKFGRLSLFLSIVYTDACNVNGPDQLPKGHD